MAVRRVFIYVRISKDHQGDGLGVERQRLECIELAEPLGWTVVGIHEDNDISAYSGKSRPGYDAMCQALEDGEADAILAWHPDRLHRRPIELEAFIDLCDRRQIEVRTVTAGQVDLSTASGKMVARMLGAAARHEVEHSIERQKAAKRQAAFDGKYRGGRRSFGWEPDGITLRDEEASAIRDYVPRILSGMTLGQAAREWTETGLRTAFEGNEFTSQTLRKVLLRPRNAGLSMHEGKVAGNGEWEPILDADTFTALTAHLNGPGRGVGVSRERRWMGSGVYFCGRCKAVRMASPRKYRNGGTVAYVCSDAPHLSRSAIAVDGYVAELVIERLSRKDAKIVLAEHDQVDMEELKTRQAAIEARLEELMVMFDADEITASQLKTGTARKKNELAEVTAEIARARKRSVLADLILAEEGIRAAWKALSPDIRGKVVDALMTVTILPAPRGRKIGGKYFDPAYVQVDWKDPDGSLSV